MAYQTSWVIKFLIHPYRKAEALQFNLLLVDKGIHNLNKGISPDLNVKVRLEFKFVN